MMTQIQSFQVNKERSKAIYKELIQGRAINRQRSVSSDLEENEFYTEIFNNFNDYKMQYEMTGFELVARPDFYYIREIDADNANTDTTKKIQALLLIIGRYVTKAGYMFDKLTHPKGGLSSEDIRNIDDTEEYIEILEAIEIKDLNAGIKNMLVFRKIMEETDTGKFVLTSAGRYFFEDLFKSAEYLVDTNKTNDD